MVYKDCLYIRCMLCENEAHIPISFLSVTKNNEKFFSVGFGERRSILSDVGIEQIELPKTTASGYGFYWY